MSKVVKEIPDKLFFRIREVAKLAEVEPYVLRFWESEFKELAPEKNRAGWRVYRRQDVEKVLEIKRLLYDEGFTIDGARKRLTEGNHHSAPAVERAAPENENVAVAASAPRTQQTLRQVKGELESILTLLNKR
ncbi:MAG: MerR family transcriptional regulator [Acidobacteriia bacterium]|nr:MerR family transcriptional regulator [Terriglobia bacterium]